MALVRKGGIVHHHGRVGTVGPGLKELSCQRIRHSISGTLVSLIVMAAII